MSNLLEITGGEDQEIELADWVEMSTFFKADGSTSRSDLIASLKRDRSWKQETCEKHAETAFKEIEDRFKSCGRRIPNYPFALNSTGTLLTRAVGQTSWPEESVPYIFMLTVSRSSMDGADRIEANLDPTRLFEELSRQVLWNLWNCPRRIADSFIFGTAQTTQMSSFESKIKHLCDSLFEGGGLHPEARLPRGGDGNLDLVTYRRFSDERSGSICGFAQCKTGENWRNHLEELRPEDFVENYLAVPLRVTPMSIFMVPERVTSSRWREDTIKAGLLMDRCRITEYAYPLSSFILRDCSEWAKAVHAAHNNSA